MPCSVLTKAVDDDHIIESLFQQVKYFQNMKKRVMLYQIFVTFDIDVRKQ